MRHTVAKPNLEKTLYSLIRYRITSKKIWMDLWESTISRSYILNPTIIELQINDWNWSLQTCECRVSKQNMGFCSNGFMGKPWNVINLLFLRSFRIWRQQLDWFNQLTFRNEMKWNRVWSLYASHLTGSCRRRGAFPLDTRKTRSA